MADRLLTVVRDRPQQAGPEELWSIQDTAAFLRVPTGTLYQWRHRRIGPPAFKLGRHLLYDPAAVRAWVVGQAA